MNENLDNLARIWILFWVKDLLQGFGIFLVKDLLQEIWICFYFWGKDLQFIFFL